MINLLDLKKLKKKRKKEGKDDWENNVGANLNVADW